MTLFKLKTYHEVIDEIYYQVKHMEPWEKGSRKTSGQTGMCGGVGIVFPTHSSVLPANQDRLCCAVLSPPFPLGARSRSRWDSFLRLLSALQTIHTPTDPEATERSDDPRRFALHPSSR